MLNCLISAMRAEESVANSAVTAFQKRAAEAAAEVAAATTKLQALQQEAEAVALLRLFYAQENQNAPQPQKRTRKQLELGAEAARETQRLPGSERGGREPDS